MTVGETSVLHHGPHRRTQVQQTQGVGHSGPGFAYPLGRFLLGHVVLAHEHLVALGLLNGVQVLPLEVFNHGQLHGLSIVGLDDDGGNLGQARHPGCAPTALSGDDLIIAGLQLPYRQGLDDAVLPDGVSQVRQRFGVKLLAGLGCAAFHLGNWQK